MTLNGYNRLLSFHCFPHQSSINHRGQLFTLIGALPSDLLPFKSNSLPSQLLYFSCVLHEPCPTEEFLPSYLPTTYYIHTTYNISTSYIFAVPTLTIVPIPLVARKAGTVVRPNVVCTMGKHVAWSENGRHRHILSSYHHHNHIMFISSSYFIFILSS